MLRSLVALVALSVAAPTAVYAGDVVAPLHAGASGKIASQAADRKAPSRGKSASRPSSGSKSAPSRSTPSAPAKSSPPPSSPARPASPARSDAPAPRSDAPARSDSAPSRSDAPAPRSDSAPPRSDAPARSDAPPARADSPARGPQPERGIDRPMGSGPHTEGGPRPLDTSRPVAGSVARHPVTPDAPANYRGVSQPRPAPHATGGRGAPPPQHRAADTARGHQQAAHAQGGHRPPQNRVEAQRWRNNYVRHQYGKARWSRPVTWFHPWYPGRPHVWYHGVFVYGPQPVYVGGRPEEPEAAPVRKVNHEGQFAVGLRAASYLSGYTNGAAYGDFGLGVAARYRPVDPLGLEVQWNYHDDSWTEGTERIQQPLSASVELFAFPWTKFNPYALAGVTLTSRNVQDDIGLKAPVESNTAFFGPHVGLGLELGLSQRVSINGDARWIGYLNRPDGDPAHAGAFQGNVGMNFYF